MIKMSWLIGIVIILKLNLSYVYYLNGVILSEYWHANIVWLILYKLA